MRPVKRGYKLACCDCGLVHRIDFAHIPYGRGRKIVFRAFRDERATAAVRREKKKRESSNNTPHRFVEREAGCEYKMKTQGHHAPQE